MILVLGNERAFVFGGKCIGVLVFSVTILGGETFSLIMAKYSTKRTNVSRGLPFKTKGERDD